MPSPAERDGRFAGYARDHFVELDFADRLESLPAGIRWVLVPRRLGGVQHIHVELRRQPGRPETEGSQRGRAARAASWVELLHEVGYPAGINHTMTLDLTGKLRPGDRKLRIATNMDLSWDRIFLAAHRDRSSVEAHGGRGPRR